MSIPRKQDKTGRSTSQIAGRRQRGALSPPAGEPFVWMTRELLSSEAYRSLSLTARKVLDRIEIEHMNHAGRENGRLKVTYVDFIDHGVPRGCILPAIRELEEKGLINRTFRGRRSHGDDPGKPGEYRLTWIGAVVDTGALAPTNEWKAWRALDGSKKENSLVRKTNRNGSENEPKGASEEAAAA